MVTELTDETFDAFVDENRFVLVDCWAPWCGPCRRMGPIIEELAEDLKGKVAVAKLNTDDNEGISMRFRINAIPTLLIFKDKVMLEPLVGLRPKQEIIDNLARNGMIEGAAPAAEEEKHYAVKVTDDTFNEFVRSKEYALVDCWATWCKSCMAMEATTLADRRVKDALSRFAVVKLDVSADFSAFQRLKQFAGVQGIPAYAIFEQTEKQEEHR